MKNRHLAIEIFELLLSGEERDRKHAVNLARKLDMDTLARLRAIGNELAILAENEYFAKGREKRGDTHGAWLSDNVWRD
jgi:hypothetical protein